jgi:ADP-ribose pyrophosphatase YjhB (NUDIX family)
MLSTPCLEKSAATNCSDSFIATVQLRRLTMKGTVKCPECGKEIEVFRNPVPTVDIIISIAGRGIVLIERRNPPYGWALPGGFIDYGEAAEAAAIREAREETSLEISDLRQFRVYSQPDRDPRQHTLTVVFEARGAGAPTPADDAKDLGVFTKDDLPDQLAFDHAKIIADYFESKKNHNS